MLEGGIPCSSLGVAVVLDKRGLGAAAAVWLAIKQHIFATKAVLHGLPLRALALVGLNKGAIVRAVAKVVEVVVRHPSIVVVCAPSALCVSAGDQVGIHRLGGAAATLVNTKTYERGWGIEDFAESCVQATHFAACNPAGHQDLCNCHLCLLDCLGEGSAPNKPLFDRGWKIIEELGCSASFPRALSIGSAANNDTVEAFLSVHMSRLRFLGGKRAWNVHQQ